MYRAHIDASVEGIGHVMILGATMFAYLNIKDLNGKMISDDPLKYAVEANVGTGSS